MCLTVEGQIAKQGSQEVHDVHNEDGDVGDLLHFLFRWAEIIIKIIQITNKKNLHDQLVHGTVVQIKQNKALKVTM